MISLNARKLPPAPDLNFMSPAFLLTEEGVSEQCCSHAFLRAVAARRDVQGATENEQHIEHCLRCSQVYSAFRGLGAHREFAPDLIVALAAKNVKLSSDQACQLFGHVSLEHGGINWCVEEDWIRNPLCLRITFVIDVLADSFGMSVADVPTTIQAADLTTPINRTSLESIEDLESFYLNCSLAEVSNEDNPEDAANRILSWLDQGILYLHFRIAIAGGPVSAFHAILHEANAIERDFDYELPSGLHSDTHVNVGALCRSEQHLNSVARELYALLTDLNFDVILTNGWAMGTIARRVAWMRANTRGKFPIDVVVREGYEQSFMSADIRKNSAVLVLIDVNVTGGLVKRMCESIKEARANIIGMAALVHALSARSKRPGQLRALCSLTMNIVDPTLDQRFASPALKTRVFNPISHCMTERAPQPRSPSEFLSTHPEALEFWTYVDRARAYEHHRREGDTHYIAFIDTHKLLEHPEIGPSLVERLLDRIMDGGEPPEVLLIANRPRARLLAEMLARSFGSSCRPTIVVARRPRRSAKRRMPLRPWELVITDRAAIAHGTVLVLDTASAQGATIDRLIHLASISNAATIKAAVLISRLPAGCEEAFSARLDGKFHCLYRLPIRPVVIRGNDPSICPVCQRRAAIEQASQSSGSDELQRWAQQLRNRARHAAPLYRNIAPEESQLRLFSKDMEFFEKCRESIASGVTLHALNAAMTNGMAALTLPELLDNRIPSRNRAAMVEHLPQGAVEWSGQCLIRDLRKVLDRGSAPNVWRASAEALVKGGEDDWFQECDELLAKLRNTGKQPSMSFWNHLACTTYAAVAQNGALQPIVYEKLTRLVEDGADQFMTEGVKRILQTMSK